MARFAPLETSTVSVLASSSATRGAQTASSGTIRVSQTCVRHAWCIAATECDMVGVSQCARATDRECRMNGLRYTLNIAGQTLRHEGCVANLRSLYRYRLIHRMGVANRMCDMLGVSQTVHATRGAYRSVSVRQPRCVVSRCL